MLQYFKIALRQLKKYRMYAFVNLLGLALGITSCLLIGVYILHELSYDAFHQNADRIVRLTMEYNTGDGINRVAVTGTKVGPQLKRTFPEVESYARTIKSTAVVRYGDNTFEEQNFVYADSSFFSIFSFPLIKGMPETVLNAPDKIVITQATARKYFGDSDPVGKIMNIGSNKDFIVSAVAKDVPANSQIQFDIVASFHSLNAAKVEKWWEANYVTYVLLHAQTNVPVFEKRLAEYMKRVSRDELQFQSGQYLTYHAEPLKKVHLYSALNGLEPNNNITYIYILAIVAILILSMACVNYTNLAIAQSASRLGEIGLRKVLGAQKRQLFFQFIIESAFLTLVALLLALVLARISLPLFHQLSGTHVQPLQMIQPSGLLVLLIIMILVNVGAGAYPAILLSKVRIINILKTGFSITGRGNSLRKSLIVLQFVISIFLIIATFVIKQQLAFIQNKELGYDKDHIIVLPVDNVMRPGLDDLKQAMRSIPHVKNIGAAYEEPTDIDWVDGISTSEQGTNQGVTVHGLPVDEDFVRTMDLQIIAGSDFSLADVQQFDTSNDNQNLRYTYMLNESAAKALGWTAEQAIGKTITKGFEGTVKAVIKDFHFESLHHSVKPAVLFLDKRLTRKMFIKVDATELKATIEDLASLWKKRVPHQPFEYHFLDEDFQMLYESEHRTADIFSTFSVVAIILACLGLFALTAYAIVQRTKEIGIRKVLGASISGIISLLSRDFVRLVIVAGLIATPLAWYAAHQWLQEFAYRIEVEWWLLIIPVGAALIIAFGTISIHAIRAATANPIKSLRTE